MSPLLADCPSTVLQGQEKPYWPERSQRAVVQAVVKIPFSCVKVPTASPNELVKQNVNFDYYSRKLVTRNLPSFFVMRLMD
jgi:hypothetical protein